MTGLIIAPGLQVSSNNANWSGPDLAIANGGTGQSTAAAAFNALSPMTTAGDTIYGGASGAATRLPAGSTGQVLAGGTSPSWAYPLGATFVNVQTYGATGNGTTDDTTAVNAAISAAGAGGTVFFPSGTYLIGAAGLTISSAVKLLGASQASTILKLGATSTQHVTAGDGTTSGNVFVSLASSSIHIESLTIDANANASFAALYSTTGLSDITLRYCTVKNSVYGAFLQNVTRLRITGCSFILNSLHQCFVQFTAAGSNIVINENYFDPQAANASASSASVSLWLQVKSGGSVKNIDASNNIVYYTNLGAVESDGLVFTGYNAASQFANLVVSGNAVSATGTHASGWGIELNYVSGFSVSGNSITSPTGGMWITGSGTDGAITGNCLICNASDTPTGTQGIANDSVTDVNITGNTIDGYSFGISVSHGNTNICGNVIRIPSSGSQYGIYYTPTGTTDKGTNISGNLIYGAGGYAINLNAVDIRNLCISNNTISGTTYGVLTFAATSFTSTTIQLNSFIGVTTRYYGILASVAVSEQVSGGLSLGVSGNGGLALGYALHTPAATLPASPALGMIAAVNTATTPALGSALSLGGGAYALAQYGASGWTVMGI